MLFDPGSSQVLNKWFLNRTVLQLEITKYYEPYLRDSVLLVVIENNSPKQSILYIQSLRKVHFQPSLGLKYITSLIPG